MDRPATCPRPITAIAISPDGRFAATAAGREVFIWDVAAKKLKYALPSEHRDAVTTVAFTPQCKLVTVSRDRAIRTYFGLLSIIPESVHQVPTHVEGIRITDLSMRWFEQTRLPFVFAVWATRKTAPPPPEIVRRLRAARSLGLGNLAAVAGTEAQRLNVPERLMQHYLWNFRYHLEAPDRLGLEAFAKAVGLAYPDDYWDV